MLITRETDYALRVLRALSDGEQHTAGEISSTQLVPKQFAYKIIKKLDKGGLVSIARGVDGGCAIHCGLAQVQQKLNEELQAHDLHTLIFGPSQAPSL